jgi:ABC-type multidrug transport system ATPase subunit
VVETIVKTTKRIGNTVLTFMSELAIELTDLSKRYPGLVAVENLNLEVKKGEIFGFLGPNGAGKSTTLRMLLSLIKPSSGSIQLFGKSLLSSRNEALSNMGCIIEKPDFYSLLSDKKSGGHKSPRFF